MALTPTQLLGGAIHLLSRMRDHIERLDAGAVTAVDDVAVVLRALVGEGRGLKVLRRVTDSLRSPGPHIWVTGPPVMGPGVRLSVGSVPTVEGAATATHGKSVPLRQFGSLRVFNMDGTTYTWDRFIRDYANKWGGAHLEESMPSSLIELELHAIGGLTLPGYLMRTAAVTVWQAGQQILRDTLAQPSAPGGPYFAKGGVATAPQPSTAPRLLTLLLESARGDMVWLLADDRDARCGTIRFGGIPYDIDHHQTSGDAERHHSPVTAIAPRTYQFEPPSLSNLRELALTARFLRPEAGTSSVVPASGFVTLTPRAEVDTTRHP